MLSSCSKKKNIIRIWTFHLVNHTAVPIQTYLKFVTVNNISIILIGINHASFDRNPTQTEHRKISRTKINFNISLCARRRRSAESFAVSTLDRIAVEIYDLLILGAVSELIFIISCIHTHTRTESTELGSLEWSGYRCTIRLSVG